MSRPEHLRSFKQSWRSFAMKISYPDDLAAIKRPDGSTAPRGTPRIAFRKLPGHYFDRRGNERFDKAALVELESHDFNLLGSLWTFINDEESDADSFTCYPSMGTLAIECGFGTATAERSMQRLEATGFVEREQRRNTSSRTIVHRTPGHWGLASKGKVVSIAAEIAPAQAAVLFEEDDAVPDLIFCPDLSGVAAQTAVSVTSPLPTSSSAIAIPVPFAADAPKVLDESLAWLLAVQKIIAEARISGLGYAIAPTVKPNGSLIDWSVRLSEVEESSLRKRLESTLPSDFFIFRVKAEGGYQLVLQQEPLSSLKRWLSDMYPKSETLKRIPSYSDWSAETVFQAMSIILRPNKYLTTLEKEEEFVLLRKKWRAKFHPKVENPAGLLVRLLPEICSELEDHRWPAKEEEEDSSADDREVEEEDESAYQASDEEDTEHGDEDGESEGNQEGMDENQYKIDELVERYADAKLDDARKRLNQNYPHLAQTVLSELKRLRADGNVSQIR